MAISTKLEMRQSQSLIMTPQLMQAIKLLQLSNIELAEFVAEEIERNPLLERGDNAAQSETGLDGEVDKAKGRDNRHTGGQSRQGQRGKNDDARAHRLSRRAKGPRPFAPRHRADAGRGEELRQQRPRLTHRHQHPDQRRRRPKRAEQKAEHQFRIKQPIGHLGQGQRAHMAQEISVFRLLGTVGQIFVAPVVPRQQLKCSVGNIVTFHTQ